MQKIAKQLVCMNAKNSIPHSKHLKLAAQGKFKFYSKKLPSHANILVTINHIIIVPPTIMFVYTQVSSLKYGGYQIGYFVWGKWCTYTHMLQLKLVSRG